MTQGRGSLKTPSSESKTAPRSLVLQIKQYPGVADGGKGFGISKERVAASVWPTFDGELGDVRIFFFWFFGFVFFLIFRFFSFFYFF
ncbi:hypothetical protein E2C01_095961 [Portunus trituberculatus]|uniref:Uncharacterized protein n=1 Tax=Portunus trituberculatus TaxID=210409 RepID=A0A5B7K5D6_PORTR|nr:hypothetical protein [Portunus trituberculatus]